MQITVAMGRAADEPDVLLQPYDLLELFPLLAALKERARARAPSSLPGSNVGYFGPYEGRCAGTRAAVTARGARRGARGSASRQTVPSKAVRACRRRSGPAANVRDRRSPRSGSARRRLALHARPHRGRSSGATARRATTPTPAAPAARGRPTCSSVAPATTRTATIAPSRCRRLGSASASCGVEAPPGEPFDHGRFDLVVEDVREGDA